MHNIKSKKSKRILTAFTAILIALSSVAVSGCESSSEQTGETKVVKETQLVTEYVDGTTSVNGNGSESSENKDSENSSKADKEQGENSSSDKKDNDNSSSGSSANSTANSSANSSAGSSAGSSTSNNKPETSKTSSSSNTSSSKGSAESSKQNTPSSNTHKPVTDSNACMIDGNKFAVGDTVTCVYKLNAPEKLENYQAEISYDTKYLSVKSAYLDGPAESGGFLNFKLDGEIKLNGSNISKNYNYTKTANFVVVEYKVKASGTTKPTFTWEVATGVSQKAYVTNNKPDKSLKLTKEYM